jgi:hypothetical protein
MLFKCRSLSMTMNRCLAANEQRARLVNGLGTLDLSAQTACSRAFFVSACTGPAMML